MSNETKINELRVQAYRDAAKAMQEIKNPAKQADAHRAAMQAAHDLERMVGTQQTLRKLRIS